ncbi:hypothetical protein HMPREF9124_0164 [Oribacterium sp. oral taxon 108 str. F0425]|nr:hypothetical protein HMPREF9124_0164 [Oribacterium sp. oral taxon 108 str. F0425]
MLKLSFSFLLLFINEYFFIFILLFLLILSNAFFLSCLCVFYIF